MRRAEDVCGGLHETAGITLDRTARGMQSASATLAVLPEDASGLLEDLLATCRSAENRQMLSGFVQGVESYQRGLASLSSFVGNTGRLLDTKTASDLAEALDAVRKWGLEASSVAEIRDLLSLCGDTTRLLQEAHASYRVLLGVAGCDAPATLPCAGFLLETVKIVHSAPFDRLHLRQRAFEKEALAPSCNPLSRRRRQFWRRKHRSAANPTFLLRPEHTRPTSCSDMRPPLRKPRCGSACLVASTGAPSGPTEG